MKGNTKSFMAWTGTGTMYVPCWTERGSALAHQNRRRRRASRIRPDHRHHDHGIRHRRVGPHGRRGTCRHHRGRHAPHPLLGRLRRF